MAVRSIESLRRRYVEEGVDAAIERKKRARPSIEPMFDGGREAKLVAVVCGPKPKGRECWTMQLLAECELSVLEKQALGDRVASEAILREQIAAWNADRNTRSKGIDWQFKTGNAKIKLRRLYSQITMC